MKGIRRGGLITFSLIIGAFAAGILFFAESISKNILQEQLTDLNNSKVDIADVKLSYSPFTIEINKLQVSDPLRPMINTVEINQLTFGLSFSDIFLKKFIVNEMTVSGIKLDTPRTTSGKLKTIRTPEEKTASEAFSFEMPDIDFPDIGNILKNEPLYSEKIIADLKTDVASTRENWQSIKEDIENEQRWDGYDAQYKKIKQDLKGDFIQKLAAIKSAKKLSQSLKSEAQKIKQAKQTFNTDVKRLNQEFATAKKAPADDVKRIKAKYRLDNLNAENISQLLFGNQAAEWMQLAKTWYTRIEPYLGDEEKNIPAPKRNTGIDIKFKEFNPMPSFLIKTVSLDAITDRGQFAGEISQISSDQSINKQPMKFKISGVNLKRSDSEKINGEFNYINTDKGFSQINYSVSRYQLNDYIVSSSNSLPLTINNSLLNINIDGRLQNGTISGNAILDFNNVEFNSKPAKGSTFSRMLASSFTDIRKFYINSHFSGNRDNLNLQLKSDLDNRIGKQLKAKLNQKKLEFEKQLKAKINDKIKEPMAKLEAQRNKLNQIKADINAKEKELKQKIAYLKQQIKNEKNIKKQKLKSKTDKKLNKQKNKIKNKLKSLFR